MSTLGGVWGKNTDNKEVCVFPKPKYYCSKYIEKPIIVKSEGKKYCVARVQCQQEICKWRDGERTNECLKMVVHPIIASVTCRATDNNECPLPTICGQDKQKQVKTTASENVTILEFISK